MQHLRLAPLTTVNPLLVGAVSATAGGIANKGRDEKKFDKTRIFVTAVAFVLLSWASAIPFHDALLEESTSSGFQFIWHGVTSTAALSYFLILIYQVFFSTTGLKAEVKYISVLRGFDWILTYPTFFLVFIYLFNYKYRGLASTSLADHNYVYIYFWVVFITMTASVCDDVFVTAEQTTKSFLDNLRAKNLAGTRKWIRLGAVFNYVAYIAYTVWFFWPFEHEGRILKQVCEKSNSEEKCQESVQLAGTIFFIIPILPYALGKMMVWAHNFELSHAYYVFGDVWVKFGIFIFILLSSKELLLTNCPLLFLHTDGATNATLACTA